MIEVSSKGRLKFKGQTYRCALGKGGVKDGKREGDGATPAGEFALRSVYYRPDKYPEGIKTGLDSAPLKAIWAWSDDPAKPDYNMLVDMPYDGSHEKMWRDDNLYDLVVVIGYNDEPPMPGQGSAIFMHVARPNYAPTDGCVALAEPDLLRVLAGCDAKTKISISK